MPIQVRCSCGQKFAARDELAGKRVQCPKCHEPLVVGGGAASSSASDTAIPTACACGRKFKAPAKLAGKAVKCPDCGQPVRVPGAKQPAAASEATQPGSPAEKFPVKCACGKTIAAKPAWIGKAVKCPGCGQPLPIRPPQAKPQAAAAPQSAAAASQKSNRNQPPAAANDPGLADLLDEVGFTTSSTGARCPNCKADIDPEAVLCIECGFHLERGKRLETVMPSRRKHERADLGGPDKKKNKAKQKASRAESDVSPTEVQNVVKSFRALGFLNLIFTVLFLAVTLYGTMMAMQGSGENSGILAAFAGTFMLILGGFLGLITALYFWAAKLIQARSHAGWTLGVILAAISLPSFPVGTIIGAVLLKGLLSEPVKRWCK